MPKFQFTVPGQPISVNHAYRPVRYKNAAGVMQRRMAKTAGVENYQLVAAAMASQAKPKPFEPKGMVYVRYWLYLKRDMDASNVLKSLEDGIAAGLGVNDRMFLPAVIYKEHGHHDPHVAVEVEFTDGT